MKTIIYIVILVIIISCTVSIAYINKPQDEVWQIIGTRTDTTTSRVVGKTISSIKSIVPKTQINVDVNKDTIQNKDTIN